MNEFFHVMALPFMACLILAGIYAYLGFHVIERQVIFVDLALAQIAILGASVALILGHEMDSTISYWLSLFFTIGGAAIFSLTRFKQQRVPQEAIIGITYAVSAALLIIVLSRSGEGDEHIKQALVGNILLVTMPEVIGIILISSSVGMIHFIFRKKFFMISENPDEAFKNGLNVRFWDFIFYASFGLVVTSSVKIAGVLLVFSFLVVPAVCAMLFAHTQKARLSLGWFIGFLASALGMAASYYLDFPTGASVVCVFGLILFILAVGRKIITAL
ncbi:MAG: metal ABC transporter permease [Candidatus Omnitrophica bacterium]|nr:metal ABC transporter permease [Candidatus Omnitrophota bacterium]